MLSMAELPTPQTPSCCSTLSGPRTVRLRNQTKLLNPLEQVSCVPGGLKAEKTSSYRTSDPAFATSGAQRVSSVGGAGGWPVGGGTGASPVAGGSGALLVAVEASVLGPSSPPLEGSSSGMR